MAILSNINGKFAVDSSGGIQFSGQTGTSGYVLKSNGNAAPTWVDGSTVIGGPYLPLSGGTLTGATATASGISFTVGGILTAQSSSSGDYVRLYGSSGTGKWDIYGNGANLRISDNESAGILAVDTGATFGGNVSITKAGTPELILTDTTNNVNLLIAADDANTFLRSSSGAPILFQTNAGTTALTLSGANATFAGTVQVNGSNVTVIKASDPNVTVSDTDTNYRGSMRWLTSSNVLEFFTRYAGTYYTNNLVLDRGNVGIGTTSPIASANKTVLGIQGVWGGQLDIMVGAVSHAQFGTDNYSTGQSARIQSKDGIVFKVNGGGTIAQVISSNGNVGIGASVTPNTKLDVNGTTGTRNRNTTSGYGSSIYETSRLYSVAGSATASVSIDTTTSFPPMVSGGYILVEVSASGYASGGANGLVFSWISGGYGGHTGPKTYHPLVVIANNIDNGSVAAYYPNSTEVGITIVNGSSNSIQGVMRVKVTTTY